MTTTNNLVNSSFPLLSDGAASKQNVHHNAFNAVEEYCPALYLHFFTPSFLYNYNARLLRDHRMSPRLVMIASPLSRVYEYAICVAEGFLDGA